MKTQRKLVILLLTVLGISIKAQNNSEKELKLYGFVRANATYDFKDLGHSDLFKPSAIPVPEEALNRPEFFMSTKQTRFGLQFNKATEIGAIKAVIEVDFHDNSNKNSGLARIRHAYVQWHNVTVGQAWSTFYDIKAKPHIVDFEGANSSTLNRAPLIRYKIPIGNDALYVAIENPTEQITITGNAQIDNQALPDFISAYRINWNNTNFIKLAALARELRISYANSTLKKELGWGVLATGQLNIVKADNIKFQAVGGKGIARYIEGVRGLGYDAVFNPVNNTLHAIGIYGGFLAYQHYWNTHWNSSIVLGTTRISSNDTLLSDTDFSYGNYASANLFYEPLPWMTYGVEYLYGQRENLNSVNADASRLQFGVTLKF